MPGQLFHRKRIHFGFVWLWCSLICFSNSYIPRKLQVRYTRKDLIGLSLIFWARIHVILVWPILFDAKFDYLRWCICHSSPEKQNQQDVFVCSGGGGREMGVREGDTYLLTYLKELVHMTEVKYTYHNRRVKSKICRGGWEAGDPEKSYHLGPNVICCQNFFLLRTGQSLIY